jgi:hypothetical protein
MKVRGRSGLGTAVAVRDRPSIGRNVRILLGALAVWAWGCQSNGDAVRAELVAQQGSWGRELAALKVKHGALKQRFNDLISTPGALTGASPMETRMRVTLDGAGQSLVDVEGQVRQVGPRVEEAIGKGREAGERALASERGRLTAELQALSADLTTAGKELDEFRKQQDSKSAAND